MSKSVRGTLLIIAAVFGGLQLIILQAYVSGGSISSEFFPTTYKVSLLLLLPAAISGVVAAVFMRDSKKSRRFAAVAAVTTLLSILVPVVFRLIDNFKYGASLTEALGFLWGDLCGDLGCGEDVWYLKPSHRWIEILGTIALVLWILCAVIPAKKESDDELSTSLNAMPNPMPVTPAQNFNPAPVSQTPLAPAPAIPASNQVPRFCTNCGTSLAGSGKFCAECGTAV